LSITISPVDDRFIRSEFGLSGIDYQKIIKWKIIVNNTVVSNLEGKNFNWIKNIVGIEWFVQMDMLPVLYDTKQGILSVRGGLSTTAALLLKASCIYYKVK